MTKASAAKAVSFLWLGTVLTSILTLGTQIFLARTLGPIAFGNFFAALAVINLVTPCVAFGVPTFWLRVFGEEGLRAKRWFLPSYKFIATSSVVVLLALFAWVGLGPNDAETLFLTATLSPIVLAQAGISLVSARLQIEGSYRSLAIWECASSVLRFALVVALVIFLGSRLTSQTVAICYMAVAVLILSYSVKNLSLNFDKMGPEGRKELEAELQQRLPCQTDVLKGAWKFGLSGLLYIIYFQVSIVMLKYLSGEAVAGFYSAAYLIVGATYTVPSVVFQKYLLPKLHRWQFDDVGKLKVVLTRGTIFMGALGAFATGSILLLGDFVLPRLFGSAYEETASILWILAFAIPLRFASTSAAAVMVSEIMLTKKVCIMGVAALTNVMMNYFLIPSYGGMGAAWATVATEAVMLVLLLLGSLKFFFAFGAEKNDTW